LSAKAESDFSFLLIFFQIYIEKYKSGKKEEEKINYF